MKKRRKTLKIKLIIFRRKKGKKFIRIGGKKCINFRYPESLNTVLITHALIIFC